MATADDFLSRSGQYELAAPASALFASTGPAKDLLSKRMLGTPLTDLRQCSFHIASTQAECSDGADGGSARSSASGDSPRTVPEDLANIASRPVPEPLLRVPSLWACIGSKWAVAVPVALVLSASTGLFLPVSPYLTVSWYPILFAALAVAAPAVVALLTAWQVRARLRGLLQGDIQPEDPVLGFTRSCVVRYRPGQLGAAAQESSPQLEGALGFLQRDLHGWASSSDGWILIDPTGIILWCNDALCTYFGYDGDRLIQQNIRILMPQPYASQHDFFMRRQIQTGVCKFLGNPTGRPVPVVDSKGGQSTVSLVIDDFFDPDDASNHVYAGRFRFNQLDPVLHQTQRRLARGACTSEACKLLDREALPRLLVDPRGTMLYVNRAGANLFGSTQEELFGQNVACLMGEPHAGHHDQWLQAYHDRVTATRATGAPVQSCLVGSGRDVVVKTKVDVSVRVFLCVDRVDLPPNHKDGYVFLATCVPITDGVPSRPEEALVFRQTSTFLGKNSPKRAPLKALMRRACTVVLVAMSGLCRSSREALQRNYEMMLKLLNQNCQRHTGVIHAVLGDLAVLTFNSAALPNSSHRTSAAQFMTDLYAAWQYCTLSRTLRLQAAATSRQYFGAQWDALPLLISDALDVGQCMLRAGREAHVPHGMIDEVLYQELKYSWTCRPINIATLLPYNGSPSQLEMYELLEMKKLPNSEWMYQLSGDASDDPLPHWNSCWDELTRTGPHNPEALVHLTRHLEAYPLDAPALWLQAVLAAPAETPAVMEVAGTLQYKLWLRRPQPQLTPSVPGAPVLSFCAPSH